MTKGVDEMGPRAELKSKLTRVAELKAIADRDFTPEEVKEIGELDARIKALRNEITTMDVTAKALKGIADEPEESGDRGSLGNKRVLNLKSERLSRQLAQGMVREASGRKSLVAAGESVAPLELQTSPVSEGRPATGLLDLVPVIPNSAARFEYLRQTARDLNAAPVAPGGLKPTSTMGLTREPGELHVVAHVSDPIDYYLLQDFEALEQFVRDEMLFGLLQALEVQLLSGDGLAPNLEGILSTSGVRSQAYATDQLVTTRKAITQLESAGLEPTGFALSPADWETIELSRTAGSGELEVLDSPVERAARRLHGLPVGVAPALTAGQGLLLSRGSVALRVDAGMQIRWSENVSDDFRENQLRARAEVRAATQVSRPSGIVSLDLAP